MAALEYLELPPGARFGPLWSYWPLLDSDGTCCAVRCIYPDDDPLVVPWIPIHTQVLFAAWENAADCSPVENPGAECESAEALEHSPSPERGH